MSTDVLAPAPAPSAVERVYEQQPLTFENEVSVYREELGGWIVLVEPPSAEDLEDSDFVELDSDVR